MNQRIVKFLQSENKSAVQFAKEVGIQSSSVSHIISGRNKPSLDLVLKMIKRYPYLSKDWLLFGVGSMYSSNELPFYEQNDNSEQNEQENMESEAETEIENSVPLSTITSTTTAATETDEIEKVVFFYKNGTFKVFNAAANK